MYSKLKQLAQLLAQDSGQLSSVLEAPLIKVIETNSPKELSKLLSRFAGQSFYSLLESNKSLEEYNVNEAKKYFEKSLNLDPNREKTCEDYGDLLLKLNQHKKALEYFKKGTGFIQFTQKDFKII